MSPAPRAQQRSARRRAAGDRKAALTDVVWGFAPGTSQKGARPRVHGTSLFVLPRVRLGALPDRPAKPRPDSVCDGRANRCGLRSQGRLRSGPRRTANGCPSPVHCTSSHSQTGRLRQSSRRSRRSRETLWPEVTCAFCSRRPEPSHGRARPRGAGRRTGPHASTSPFLPKESHTPLKTAHPRGPCVETIGPRAF